MQEHFEEFEEDDEEGFEDKAPAAMVPAGKLTFIRDSHELSNTFKSLAKANRAAIRKLNALSRSSDERIALDAAKSIVDLNLKVATEINKDALQRTLLEIKNNQASQVKQIGNDKQEGILKPLVNFNDIQDVS